MNSVANGKVYLRSPFKKMYLPAAAGDAGGAIGAAFVLWGNEKREGREGPNGAGNRDGQTSNIEHGTLNIERNGRFVMRHAYTGPEFEEAAIEELLRGRGLLANGAAGGSVQEGLGSIGAGALASLSELAVHHLPDSGELCRRTARAISEGKVVGWFQGRMEWGPRALGNRSILGDPRRADMKDILNAKIKRRESFRPFAPSILREHVAEWFETDDDVPFMMQVFQFRAEKRSQVPAVCHVDGSGR